MSSGRRLRSISPEIWLFAAAAYIPTLTAAPGRMPTDTKLFLYLDPGRLLADASLTWDVRQFGGWVPHQVIAYLWPSGPWFWSFEQLGVPDWIAHRLWLGTVLIMGGLGVRWAAKHLGVDRRGAAVAGLLYMFTPYVLPYVSRTSVMLLPWAGLGWLIALTVRAATRQRGRDIAAFALVVFTIGAVNATALALIAPGPLLWLVHAGRARLVTWRAAVVTAVKLGAASLAVSTWWIAMLLVQGRHGADLLRFSETLRDVSYTSVSVETLRGLGYWLFYIADPYAHTTTASIPYLTNPVLIGVSFVVPALCLAALAAVRWQHRRFAAWSIIAGLVLAVGVHPYDNPSPLMRPLVDSVAGLALRSSTRALPLAVMGMALAAGAAVTALGTQRRRQRDLVAVAFVALAVVNLPAAWTGGYVDPALERDQDVPAAWTEAVTSLDRGSSEYRVLQLPGSEFGAFSWGYTVDPPLAGLTDRPLVTRDLLPLGSPGAMDLLYALDNRFQAGVVDPMSLAPVARLLGADTIWVSNDLAFDRFRTPRPEVVADIFRQRPPGLGDPRPFGEPTPVVSKVAMLDEVALSDPRVGEPLAPVELVDVSEPVPVIRTATRTILVSGSGDGLVDAAAAGLIDGSEAVVYAADLALDDEMRERLLAAATSGDGGSPVALIVTDSNRDRAVHWRSSQDVTGMTESGGPQTDLLRDDSADQRLEVFSTSAPSHQTVAVLRPQQAVTGDLTVRATGYGEPFAYRPEHRPSMAVDGDPATAWLVGIRGNPIGESIEISSAPAQLTLLQSQDPHASHHISTIRVAQADEEWDVALDERSLAQRGQLVALPQPGEAVTITITGIVDNPDATDAGPSGVGFAEVGVRADEVVLVPSDLLADIDEGTRLALVLRRDRTRPTDRWRSDPEPVLRRGFDLPVGRTFSVTATLRLDARAPDAAIAAIRGEVPVATASERLPGVVGAGGAAAVDGDPTTAWTTPFGDSTGAALTVRVEPGVALETLTLVQRADGQHSLITGLRVESGDQSVEVPVSLPDATGAVEIELPGSIVSESTATITITAIEPRTTIDRRYGETTVLPASIVDVSGLPLAPPSSLPRPTGCRDDLLSIDGAPVALEVGDDELDRLLAGEAVTVQPCEAAAVELAQGSHTLVAPGDQGGAALDAINVDHVVLRSSFIWEDNIPAPAVVEVARGRSTRELSVGPCSEGCWLIFGEGYNPAWTARIGTADLGPAVQISGGFNGWWLEPSSTAQTVVLSWPPQRRVDLALAATALAVLACLITVARGRRLDPVPAEDPPRWEPIGERDPARRVVVAAAALVAAAGALIQLRWALYAIPVAGLLIVARRARLAAWGAAGLTALLGAAMVVRQVRNDKPASASWIDGLDEVHGLGLFVVTLLVAASFERAQRLDITQAAQPSPDTASANATSVDDV